MITCTILSTVKADVDITPSTHMSSDTSQTFLFKSSWLERVQPTPIIVGLNSEKPKNYFLNGDRVQLNFGTWMQGALETCGKCLGVPLDFKYGVVYSEGIIKDGVQRNIEVFVVNEDFKGDQDNPHLSLYPSFALVKANLGVVIQNTEQVTSLLKTLAEICPFEIAPIFKKSSLQVRRK